MARMTHAGSRPATNPEIPAEVRTFPSDEIGTWDITTWPKRHEPKPDPEPADDDAQD